MSAMIREALPGEISRIIPLVLEGWSEYEAVIGREHWLEMRASLASFEPHLAAGTLFVAERHGALIGCVAYYGPGFSDGVIFPREWSTVRLLTILPSARGLGLGRLLMERCVEAARADDAEILGLHTNQPMSIALGLYERMGFLVDTDLPEKYGMARWRFKLPLRPAAEEQAGAR